MALTLNPAQLPSTRKLLTAVMITALALFGSAAFGWNTALANECYPSVVTANIANSNGYAYGEGKGECNNASEHHTLDVCIREDVSGFPDHDITCSSEAGYYDYYFDSVEVYNCANRFVQVRIDSRSASSYHYNLNC